LQEEIIKALRETLKNEEKISVAYLFGSYARGVNTPVSDVD
jgi:predicted nucleotidyltransferase